MNDLTLFLYIAEIAGRIPVVSFFSIMAFFIVWFFAPPKGEIPFEGKHETALMGFYYAKPLMWVAIVSTFLAFLTPSKETLYLMAGAEIAEVVVATPEAQEIMNDVKQIIDIQLDKLKQ